MFSPASRLESVRAFLRKEHLDAYLVTNLDRFLQVTSSEEHWPLKWTTGFDGSSGLAFVLQDCIYLLTDARYASYAETVVFPNVKVVNTSETSLESFCADILQGIRTLGCDPWCTSTAMVDHLRKVMPMVDCTACTPPDLQPESLTASRLPGGMLKEMGHTLRSSYAHLEKNFDAHDGFFCGNSTALSWLMCVRTKTYPYLPILPSYGLLTQKTLFLWCNKDVIDDKIRDALEPLVCFIPLEDFDETYTALLNEYHITCASSETPWAVARISEMCEKPLAYTERNPVTPLQIVKTDRERAYLDKAQKKEGVAFSRLIFDVAEAIAREEKLTEWDVVCRLEEIRRADPTYQGPSFPTISATGINGAQIHYRPSEATAQTLKPNSLLLVDAGGQYLPGATTDTTRTVCLGAEVDTQHKIFYTRVLKGFIAYVSAVFPVSTRGVHLEGLVRSPLWEVGCDYAHATGHGVGAFLNVHEPPTLGARDDGIALKAGMVLTCEPGYYKEKAFGLRIENMMTVEACEKSGREKPFLRFQQATYVPLDTKLIDTSLLTESERLWVNDYHDIVLEKLMPLLEDDSLQNWLEEATEPLKDMNYDDRDFECEESGKF